MAERLIHQLVLASAARNGDRPAYWQRTPDGFAALTYAELAVKITALARGLIKSGFKPQTKAGIYAPDSPDWGITYLAILAAGGVVVPLDQQSKYLELRSIITRAGINMLFCDPSHYQDILDLKLISPQFPDVICIDDSDVDDSTILTTSKLAVAGRKEVFPLPEIDPESLAVLIYTSGTSSEAKGVMLSHANIVADLEAVRPRLPMTEEDRFLSVLPLHHTLEATCGFIYPLSCGASVAYGRSLKSVDIIADIRALKITVMIGVPLLFEKMCAGINRQVSKKALSSRLYVDLGQRMAGLSKWILDLSVGKVLFRALRERVGLDTIRLFVSGGAAINPEVSRFFNNLGIVLLQGYGLSETSPVLAVNCERDNNYYSVGKPLDGVDLKILDKNEAGIGEIAARGKMVMLGYYGNEDATRSVMQDGFFCTGDLGYVDSAGHLHITGRMKNVIITPAGKNIYPEEIEALLESSPFVSECAVLPRKRKTGEEPVAVVVPDFDAINAAHEGAKLSDEEFRTLMKAEVHSICEQLAEFKRIKDVIVMTAELPKTSTRKVKRHVLIENLKTLGQL
ncbi:MAG: AMP-binding protein [candidate division Zixibacteria bacterium]|nr:AMP-binding protein [candidate division Zixibacteria bacterium]